MATSTEQRMTAARPDTELSSGSLPMAWRLFCGVSERLPTMVEIPKQGCWRHPAECCMARPYTEGTMAAEPCSRSRLQEPRLYCGDSVHPRDAWTGSIPVGN